MRIELRHFVLAVAVGLLSSHTGVGLVHAQVISGVVSGGGGLVQGPVPSGVISGTVVDERGAPVAHVSVYALYKRAMPDGRTMEFSQSAPTDEGGRFRIDRLAPQSYVVLVAPAFIFRPVPPGVVAARAPDDQPLYALTYFPGVINRAQAQSIPIASGGEETIFVELQRVLPLHVRGTVSSPSGRSTAGMPVQLQRSVGTSSSSTVAANVQEDGSFDIAVAPGNYTLMVSVSPGPAPTEFAVAEIQVSDRDLDGVAMTLGPGGSLRGQIVFDGASREARHWARRCSFQACQAARSWADPSGRSRWPKTGPFRLEAFTERSGLERRRC